MLRVCAVAYLNTSPLVWGMLHGPQHGVFDLSFETPSRCADAVASNDADIGLIPSIELERQELAIVPGLGIASAGAVRSILLISKVPAGSITSVAADASSRTSVALTQVVLAECYGARPLVLTQPPTLEPMLAVADAALIIGDPALRLDPERLPYHVYDLGFEWTQLTGLPMVFAVWAGREHCMNDGVAETFHASYRYGRDRLDEIVRQDAMPRGFAFKLARDYLTRDIVYELGPSAYDGLALFRRLAREYLPK